VARKPGSDPVEPQVTGEEIIDTDVSDELRSSFLEYSMSVIVARALPDARDGLKPVQRRILYSMHEAGMLPSKGYHKCARVVGAVMGALHPHGDSAIYEALVRIAQDFSLRLPLVDGHGNFGSLDDGPAASRYTEARLAKSALSMVSELDEDTVDFKPNYDGRETEPVVLPAAFPNLLVNGTTGIAVGMATNMAPHNLVEVISGLRAMLENPKMTVDELMVHIPGPDLPSGAIIAGLDGVRDAYRTGRGAFRMRAKAEVTDVSARRRGIIVTELPFNVGPEKVIARIKELISDKKLQGVSDVRDYSDRKVGLRLVIECKTGFNPHAVLDDLYRLTPLEEGFSVNNVALVDNQRSHRRRPRRSTRGHRSSGRVDQIIQGLGNSAC
jgi:DNA gyrase subunit A